MGLHTPAHIVDAARQVLGVMVAIAIGASLVAAVIGAQGRFDETPAPMPAPTLVVHEERAPSLPGAAEPTPYPTPAGA
jgi:hypothetical protein